MRAVFYVGQRLGSHALAASQRSSERGICLRDGSGGAVSISPAPGGFLLCTPPAAAGRIIERWLKSGKIESMWYNKFPSLSQQKQDKKVPFVFDFQ